MLDDKTILQTDATIIAGLLILLSITSLQHISAAAFPGAFLQVFVLSFVIVLFSLSIIMAVLENVRGAKNAMVIGFGALALGIIWLLWSNLGWYLKL